MSTLTEAEVFERMVLNDERNLDDHLTYPAMRASVLALISDCAERYIQAKDAPFAGADLISRCEHNLRDALRLR